MTNSPLPADHAARLERARLALDGLSVGDALGETCFVPDNFDAFLDEARITQNNTWRWTDDTAMAHGIFEVLEENGHVDQDALAKAFARIWKAEPWRGYGAGAYRLLGLISAGADWRAAAESLFGGGSFGNGSAMRIAPLAGYFAEDGYEKVAEQAARSAVITHAHAEGIAGAIATAVAGAYAWVHRTEAHDPDVKRGLFKIVLEHTPAGEVREGVERAASFTTHLPKESDVRLLDHGNKIVPFDVLVRPVVLRLGNGSQISCQDTVPYCIWVASHCLDNFELAMVNTIRAGGDIDTNAAIVGGIVALAVGTNGIPDEWRQKRETLRCG